VRLVDIAPTALELLGLAPLRDVQGISLASLMAEPTRDLSLLGYGESFESASFFGLSPIRFVREGRWKYIHKVNPELYDIQTDPHELDNLTAERPDITDRLRKRLEELLREAPAKPSDSTTAIDSQLQAQLQALGYVTNDVTPTDFDELASLDVSGVDPTSKIETMAAIADAIGSAQNERYDDALATLLVLVKENPNNTFILSRLAENHVALEANTDAIEIYLRLLAIDSCHERSLTELNRLWRITENYDALVATLRQGAEACPTFAGNLNNYAWALATLSREDLRDGETAVLAAERAIELMQDRPAGFLDTLAAALAEAGRFDEAIAIQSEALLATEGAGLPSKIVDQLHTHLEAIRAGEPIRSKAVARAD
jgi:hypothetical protein